MVCSLIDFCYVKCAIVLIIIFKFYLKITTGWCRSRRSLEGKTAIVTGANTGIGYETALDLIQRGARTILACRNKERAEDARKRLIVATGRDNITVKIVDLASFESIRNFAKDINETEERLDILINNAGVGGMGNQKTKDGIQILMQINYFGPFLLTNLLLDLLKKTPSSRIVNVSSIMAKYAGELDVKNLNAFPGDTKLYSISKLCNVLFTIQLAKKLEGTGVTTNSLHPGAVETEIMRKMPFWMKLMISAFVKLFFKSAKEGAQTSIYVAVDEKLENVTGEHFADCKQVTRYDTAKDPVLAEKLWNETEKIIEANAQKSK